MTLRMPTRALALSAALILSLAASSSAFSLPSAPALRPTVLALGPRTARPQARATLGLKMQGGEQHPLHGAIDKVIKDNKIILFMKGNKDFPQCGFSNTAVQVLTTCGAQFEAVNVLENENIRQGIKAYSNWPTIPQLYIGGEFIGGADIMIEMYNSGEMKELVEKTMAE
eukprot:CAMPEP_0173390998 /NCGR_PEP_ID=MMETSP1356-20130122/16886_1 /TAXON_ID=77927 ORGANISM="Hemiselmis virescens, Strain PCC157" /NCGR_SAMPLE_ID=MMETSP1356 /ASSEMBLY_ACC=CAM_ASM_000847 /LENGTH=169 /DNA_ID=CAMNT_0014348509 /DNA_START=29 /DNA_END=538 /DNA_ORIENTATION=+